MMYDNCKELYKRRFFLTGASPLSALSYPIQDHELQLLKAVSTNDEASEKIIQAAIEALKAS